MPQMRLLHSNDTRVSLCGCNARNLRRSQPTLPTLVIVGTKQNGHSGALRAFQTRLRHQVYPPRSVSIRGRPISVLARDELEGLSEPSVSEKVSAAAAAAAKSGSGSLFGAIALITGSTVGAGMLALPAVTAPAGFIPTAAGLTGTWALLACQAMLMAEVNLSLMAQQGNSDKIVTLRQMAEQTLGKPGKAVTVVYLLLSYCLLVAYLAKAAEVIDFFAGHALPPAAGASAFVAATAALFIVGGAPAADKVNQAMTSLLLVMFALILGVGFTQTDVPHAITHGAARWDAIAPAVPIMFLSLVYHDLVPVICCYLKGDRKLVRSALLLGSLVPLGMFLSWEAVALALIPSGLGPDPQMLQVGLPLAVDAATSAAPEISAAAASSATAAVQTTLADSVGPSLTVDPLQVFVRRSGPLAGSAVQGFSFLAVFTSFLGTVMGLSETLRSEAPGLLRRAGRTLGVESMATFDEDAAAAASEVAGGPADPSRVLALALTLGPPLAFTAENPDAFLAVLSIAGGYGMTAMYGVLPPLMASKLRSQNESNNQQPTTPAVAAAASSGEKDESVMLPGGSYALAGLLVAATGVGISRLATDAGAAVAAAGGDAHSGNFIETALNLVTAASAQLM